MNKKMLGSVVPCFVLLALCVFGYAQSNGQGRARQSTSQADRGAGLSELGKENLSRVAASSVQIQVVLLKDAGLLVELKRWVAKEATDNGQVVEDSNLSDQAIFDRLDHDVAFRAVATKLVQRYGYLLPSPNPDSSFAKEEDFVLKERARRLVQIESQEDTESLQHGSNDRKVDRTSTCDPQQDEGCESANPSYPRSSRQLDNGAQTPETTPGVPQDTRPVVSPPRTLKTDYSGDESEPRDRSSSPEIELASSSVKAGGEAPSKSLVPDFLQPPDDRSTDRNSLLVRIPRSRQRARRHFKIGCPRPAYTSKSKPAAKRSTRRTTSGADGASGESVLGHPLAL